MSLPRIRRLSPLVRAVLAPNPSPMTLDGTNTYLVGERDVVVVDPGPDDAAHLARLSAEAGRPSLVLLTHRHPDHAESAVRFAAEHGVPVAAAPGDGAEPVADGAVIRAPGATLRAVATPGHASDHLCFLLEEERALLTGDHILGEGTTVVAHPDGDMREYLASLERLKGEDVRVMYPGHGPVVTEPRAVLDYYITHRLEREEQVTAAIADGHDTVEAMVAHIYADVDPRLHPAAALSVRAHLDKLAAEGRARADGDRWRLS